MCERNGRDLEEGNGNWCSSGRIIGERNRWFRGKPYAGGSDSGSYTTAPRNH